MSTLTPDQARALWDAGGFAVLTGLPPGSECGIDGSFHAVNKFAGYKFVPPGVHVVSWAAERVAEGSGSEDRAGPGFSLRSALIHAFEPRERVAIAYDAGTEEAARRPTPSDAELRALDPALAAYPFDHLGAWKALTGYISRAVLDACLADVAGMVDGLTPVVGEVEEEGDGRKRKRGEEAPATATARAGGEGGAREASDAGDTGDTPRTETPTATPTPTPTTAAAAGRVVTTGAVPAPDAAAGGLHFPIFDLRRSWPLGASGADVSRWSQDKSMLWARVVGECGGPDALLGYTQLSYILVREVWSAPALGAYKRLVALLCRSATAIAEPDVVVSAPGGVRETSTVASSAVTSSTPTGPDATTGADAGADAASARASFLGWIDILASQISGLPSEAFTTELPGLDAFYADEIGALARGLGAALGTPAWWSLAARTAAAWARLSAAAAKVGIYVSPLPAGDEDESDEEGEYAPVVVETEE